MKDMIERYIYDVTRRLPEAERGEVKRELGANIADMLPENPSARDIEAVLTKLGPPRELAEQYRQTARYLISPGMFELYISVLKTVLPIVAVICACVGVFTTVMASAQASEVVGTGLGTAIEGVLQAAFWITVGFAIADRTGRKQEWTLKDLPDLPEEEDVTIRRSSSLVGMILSVFFPVLIIFMILHGNWLLVLASGADVIIPFSQAALERAIPFIVLLGALGVLINAFKLYWARWNIRLCLINIVQNLLWLGIVLYILHWPDLFSPELTAFVNTLFADNAGALAFIRSGGIVLFFTVIFVLGAVIDIGTSVWNTWKGRREQRTAS